MLPSVKVPSPGLSELPCTHILHPTCAEQWLKLNPTCPLCRKPCKYSDTKLAEHISQLPDDTFISNMEEGEYISSIKEENLICTNGKGRYICNILNRTRSSIFDMPERDDQFYSLLAFSGISVALSRRIGPLKHVIDVYKITNKFEPRQLKGLHWEPKALQTNNDDTLLACLCDQQITVWNIVSGQSLQTFTNLSQNREYPNTIISFCKNDFLQVYYSSSHPTLISYNMQNFEVERCIDFGYSDDKLIQVYEKQNKKSFVFGDGYIAKIEQGWKFSHLEVYTLKKSTSWGKFFDKETTITKIYGNENLRAVSYDGNNIIATLFSNGVIKLFDMTSSSNDYATVLKILDTKLKTCSLIFYKEDKLACHDRKTLKIWKF